MAKNIQAPSLVRDVAELMRATHRASGAIATSQVLVPAKDRLVIATNGQPATWQLSALPSIGDLGSSLNLSLNGLELDEATDYSVDYTTGIVTFSVAQQALFKVTPAPADVLTADYLTSDDGIANTQPVDTGSITDSFNRANATALGTTSDGLGTWIAPVGSSYGQIGITSNQAALKSLSSGGTPIGMSYIDVGSADGTLQVTFPVGFGDEALAFRIQDFANYWQAGFNNATTGRLYKVVGGNFTAVGVTWPMTVGDKVTVVLLGSSITVKNTAGTVVASTTDSTFSTVTKHGLVGYNLSDRWEDWSWTP